MKKNKAGSAAVLLVMIFVTIMGMILGFIAFSRSMVIKSESNMFGQVWAKAILSEYDKHLLEDYNIMAFQGNESDITSKLKYYMKYSMDNKLNITKLNVSSDTAAYNMRNPDNFKKAMRNIFITSEADNLSAGKERIPRNRESAEYANHVIRNKVVIDTLPSGGIKNTIDIKILSNAIKDGDLIKNLKNKGSFAYIEAAFIKKYFNSHTHTASAKKTYFDNEWEYIIKGSMDDEKNLTSCKRRIFLLRNSLNIAYLYSDNEKRQIVISISEMITPGPMGAATQLIIMESWAAAESKYDLDKLLDRGNIDFIKTKETWHTDLDSVISSDEIADKLDEESKELLADNKGEIDLLKGGEGNDSAIGESGQNYEDYLMMLIMIENENIRVLRIMDLIQINMKCRYYDDFNFEEYSCGVEFTIAANGEKYEIQDSYK